MTVVDSLHESLKADQISVAASVLEQHSHDESYHRAGLPEVVVFPESTADVVAIVKCAAEHNCPIIPFGAGSGLEGHVVPLRGGISVDMTRMNQILDVRTDDFLVRVQPGVTRMQLNRMLRPYGLFFPVDPGADATLGGMAATNASGTTTVRYGAMRNQVQKLEVVLADGRVMSIGSLAAKSSSGYHLTGLFIGSEGTLGVITELWLRVHGLPERMVAARVNFPSVEDCVRACTTIIGSGVAVARLEFVDPPYMKYINEFSHTTYPEVPTLLMEFHGGQQGVVQELERAKDIAQEEGCTEFVSLLDETSRNTLWEARHSARHALMAQFPGYEHMATDVCVPISKLPEAVLLANQLLSELGLNGAILGHVGDGNYHVGLALNTADEEEMARAYQLNERIVEHALSLGGTCTGEHGVGMGKKKYQAQEHGAAVELMREIKHFLDPKDLMNPGKLVSD